ncbi:MAG: hypothetical protein NT107_08815 [Planctomycetota bacterium]|nr:hypothetical protein [Planctomycetota bacterium]
MKQNEKLLVYAVTGFLVVILMLAVVLGGGGRDGARQPESAREMVIVAAPSLEEVLNSAKIGLGKVPDQPVALLLPIEKPLAAPVVIQPPTSASLVTERLGLSRRENGFRIVRVQTKDTFGGLLQKWCGKPDAFMESAQCLNEELDVTRLRAGSEITLPLVEDDVLLAAYEARMPRPLSPVGGIAVTPAGSPAGSPAVSPAGAPAGAPAGNAALGGVPPVKVVPSAKSARRAPPSSLSRSTSSTRTLIRTTCTKVCRFSCHRPPLKQRRKT